MRALRESMRAVLGSRSPREWGELACVVAIVFAGLLAVTFVTPYAPPNEPSVGTSGPGGYLRAVVEQAHPHSVTARVMDGQREGQQVTVPVRSHQSAPIGATILVAESGAQSAAVYHFIDRWRLPGLVVIFALFVVLVVLVGGRQGMMSLVGLVVSLLILGWGVLPLVIAGWPVFWVCLSGALVIAVVSVLIAHGRKPRTYVAIAAIIAIMLAVALLSVVVVALLGLTGVTDEVSLYLALDQTTLDMHGVVAGGMLIATLGVLDDIVTAQVATVDELHKAQPQQSSRALFAHAISVGKEHIASLVNTLALAYAGAALPFVLFIAYGQGGITLLLINGEFVATEIARTLVASIGLVLAVPLSTLAAIYVFRR